MDNNIKTKALKSKTSFHAYLGCCLRRRTKLPQTMPKLQGKEVKLREPEW